MLSSLRALLQKDARRDLYCVAAQQRAIALTCSLVASISETESPPVPFLSFVQPAVRRPDALPGGSPPALGHDSPASAARQNPLPVAHGHPVLSEEPSPAPAHARLSSPPAMPGSWPRLSGLARSS